jgi:sodium/bile acid cotransporter 7
MKWNRNRPIGLFLAGLILAATGPPPGQATASPAESLTDSQKREKVYAMYAGYRENFPDVADISPAGAMALHQEGKVVFVDTRTPEERAVSTLPEAVSAETFRENPNRFSDRVVVAYCTISYRSGLFAREMAQRDPPIRNLRGGMLAWALEGGKLYRDGEETRRMHVYGKKWDYPPEGYESVRFTQWRQWMKSW